jgi:hypothetical protein
MQDLLTRIKAALQDSATLSYVRDSDIYVTENELLLPAAVRFPAIALKDGAIAYQVATQDQENDSLAVKVIAYAQLQKPEAAIMGDASTGAKGVLQIAADIITVLKDNRLAGTVDSAWPEGETESETITADEQAIQMKITTMRYMRY